MPVWRLGDGEHLKGLAGKISFLKHYPQTEQLFFSFSVFISSSQPSVLDNTRSVSFPVYIGWKQQGLTISKTAPRVCSKECEGVEHRLNLRGRGTGMRQDQESPALMTTDHASVELQNQMLLGISLVPWWLSLSTPHCSSWPEVYPCSRSLVLLEIVWRLELEYQTPNSD